MQYDFAHPLRVWRIERKLTLAAFGKLVGCSDALISYIETYKKRANPALVKKIEAVTEGRVKPSDFRLKSPVKNPKSS